MIELFNNMIDAKEQVDTLAEKYAADYCANIKKRYVEVFKKFIHTTRMRMERRINRVLGDNNCCVVAYTTDTGTITDVVFVSLADKPRFSERVDVFVSPRTDIASVWHDTDMCVSVAQTVLLEIMATNEHSRFSVFIDKTKVDRIRSIYPNRIYTQRDDNISLDDLCARVLTPGILKNREARLMSIPEDRVQGFIEKIQATTFSDANWSAVVDEVNNLAGKQYLANEPIITVDNLIENKGE